MNGSCVHKYRSPCGYQGCNGLICLICNPVDSSIPASFCNENCLKAYKANTAASSLFFSPVAAPKPVVAVATAAEATAQPKVDTAPPQMLLSRGGHYASMPKSYDAQYNATTAATAPASAAAMSRANNANYECQKCGKGTKHLSDKCNC